MGVAALPMGPPTIPPPSKLEFRGSLVPTCQSKALHNHEQHLAHTSSGGKGPWRVIAMSSRCHANATAHEGDAPTQVKTGARSASAS
eukprot:15432439-Alexandrium_andersonii.AAC.1